MNADCEEEMIGSKVDKGMLKVTKGGACCGVRARSD